MVCNSVGSNLGPPIQSNVFLTIEMVEFCLKLISKKTSNMSFSPFNPPNFSVLTVFDGLKVICKPYNTTQIDLLTPMGRSVLKIAGKVTKIAKIIISSARFEPEFSYFHPQKYVRDVSADLESIP